jgi:hypothetical protein
MKEAFIEAERGFVDGGIPIGSVLVVDGKIVGYTPPFPLVTCVAGPYSFMGFLGLL